METETDRVLKFTPRATDKTCMEDRERKKNLTKSIYFLKKNIMVEDSHKRIQSSKIFGLVDNSNMHGIDTYHVISEVSHIYRRDK